MHLGERLREERERLGFNQSDFAALAGATRKTQFNYESGERSPDAYYFQAILSAGADVLYILTGVRAEEAALQSAAAQNLAGYSVEKLKPDEAALLDNYRHSTPEAQAALKATSDALAQSREVKSTRRKREK